MEEGDVRFLAGVYSLQARVESVKAEIEALKANNNSRPDEAGRYGEQEFWIRAERLEQLAIQLGTL